MKTKTSKSKSRYAFKQNYWILLPYSLLVTTIVYFKRREKTLLHISTDGPNMSSSPCIACLANSSMILSVSVAGEDLTTSSQHLIPYSVYSSVWGMATCSISYSNIKWWECIKYKYKFITFWFLLQTHVVNIVCFCFHVKEIIASHDMQACASCQLRKIAGNSCAGNSGNVFPNRSDS